MLSNRKKPPHHHSHQTTNPTNTPLQGKALLSSPTLNKGSAFPPSERRTFALSPLLPARAQILNMQVQRAYEQYSQKTTDIGKNTFMTSLESQNEVLYYKVIQTHLKEMMPIIYTPTEGKAIANYSRLFRGAEGVFLTVERVDSMEEDLEVVDVGGDEVDVIVVSDGEQIWGLAIKGLGVC